MHHDNLAALWSSQIVVGSTFYHHTYLLTRITADYLLVVARHHNSTIKRLFLGRRFLVNRLNHRRFHTLTVKLMTFFILLSLLRRRLVLLFLQVDHRFRYYSAWSVACAPL